MLLGTVRTDDSGAFTLAATVPAGLPAGTHTVVVVVDGVTVGSTTVTVVADAAGSDGELAFTGAEGLVPAAIAALLALLAGTGIVGAPRRRGHRAWAPRPPPGREARGPGAPRLPSVVGRVRWT